MPWFKIDDNFAFHRKAVAAGNTAIGLWTRAGAWCSAQLTDGHVPTDMVKLLGGRPTDAKKLVDAGLWHQVDGGYQFHQWSEDDRQPKRSDVVAKRSEWRQRKARSRAVKEAAGS